MSLREILALIGIAIGVAFCAAGIIGFIRLPDVYTRIHAAGKVSTLGWFGLAAGVALLMPETTPKALALVILALLISPIATHVVALAAHRQGVPHSMTDGKPARDDLTEWERIQGMQDTYPTD